MADTIKGLISVHEARIIMLRWIALVTILILILQPVSAEEKNASSASVQNIPVPDEMGEALNMIIGEVTEDLGQIRDINKISAENLSTTGISGDAATEVITEKIDNVTYGHSSFIISPENIVTCAAPSNYEDLIGTDLSYQPETRFANEQKSPVISNIFYLEEGFYGISISYPIFSENNEYLGYTDVTIRPEEYFRPAFVPFTETTGYEVFIYQTDGMTVYETNEVEIGKNILTDPLYDTPELQNITHAITEKADGSMDYIFWNTEWNKEVLRQAVWKTLKTDNQEWRIGVVRNIRDDENVPGEPTSDVKPADLNASIADMNAFTLDAGDYARSTDKETACAAFNNLTGSYVSGDRYIFAYDMNGTTLALPYQQGLLGKSRMDLTDVNGFAIIPALIDAAKGGGQNLYAVYPNPDNGFQNQLKLYRIEPVDDEWFIGSGLYLPWVMAEFSQDNIDASIERVKNAVRHAEEVGKEQAVHDFNDLNQSFADGPSYIFAYDYNGTTLAMPFQPEVIGTNRMNYTDMYGCKIAVQEIDAAKRGGGFVYVVYYNPDTKKNELKLCYVLPAGEDWLVGSGFYAGTDLSS